MQNKFSSKQKFLLILFGSVIAFLLAEILFRIGGVIVHRTMLQNNVVRNNAESIILCLGDSSTFGIGARNINKYSYPAQLQKILDEKHSDKRFKVINQGVPGINSSQLLHRFSSNLLKYKPDTVIVQVGENDYWNLEESNIADYYNVGFLKKLMLSTELIFNYSKLYSFFKLVSVSYDNEKIIADTAYTDTEMTVPEWDSKNTKKNKRYGFSLSNPANTIAYTRLINDNFTKITQIAKQNNIKIVFLRYHVGGYRSIHFFQEQLFDQLNVPFVNNRTVFVEAQKRGMNPFSYDKWHPGDLGYFLIAMNIYNKFISLGIVEGESIDIFESLSTADL